MQESTITIKGQTTLPRDIRAALDLAPGDKLRYLVLDNGEVRLLKSRAAAELGGILRRERPTVSLEDMDAAISEGAQADDRD